MGFCRAVSGGPGWDSKGLSSLEKGTCSSSMERPEGLPSVSSMAGPAGEEQGEPGSELL